MFICREHAGNLIDHVRNRGYQVIILDRPRSSTDEELTPHSHWLETSWQSDAEETVSSLDSLATTDWLIVDHYALDESWENTVAEHVSNILVIDDLADRKHNARILLDQNYYTDNNDRYRELIPEDCIRLTGTDYTLLRDEFIEAREHLGDRNTDIDNILIFFGGVDAANLTLKSLIAIRSLHLDVEINAVIGTTNPHRDELETICSSMHNTHLLSNVNNMAELMLKADLGIFAGGTTTWERCYLGLPSIVFTLADNQATVNRDVAAMGACILAGDTSTSSDSIADEIQGLVDRPERLIKLSENSLSLMKGHVGAQAVVKEMENITIGASETALNT